MTLFNLQCHKYIQNKETLKNQISDKTMNKETEDTNESASAQASNLGRYFDDSAPTIFDEIVSPTKADVFSSFDTLTGSAATLFRDNADNSLEDSVKYSSISDYHRDAWIPSENTRKILRTIATSTTGINQIDRENLTMPGLALANEMSDPTKDVAVQCLGEEEVLQRNVPTAMDVTQDERGLRDLIRAGCYRAAVNLSGRLLAIYGQGFGKINHPSKHTPHSLQLWFTRLSLLTKLKQTEVLVNESIPFGNLDKPDMYFTFYPELYGTRPGSMAPFSFRLLLAEIPLYCGEGKRAIDNLYKVVSIVEKIIQNLTDGLSEEGGQAKFSTSEIDDSLWLWKRRRSRILISIVNCALAIKNYALAVDILEDMCKSTEGKKNQIEILKSAIGRVHLSLGDVSAAEKKFSTVKSQSSTSNDVTVRELIDRGLMAVAQNAFQEAYNCFKTASEIDPSNIMLINNMAVCLLYTGKLENAVHLMEKAIEQNPSKSLQESVLLNMSTLYELHTTHSKHSKLKLLSLLNKYKGDATDIQCLKMGM